MYRSSTDCRHTQEGSSDSSCLTDPVFSYVRSINYDRDRIIFWLCGATDRSGPGLRHYQGFTITLKHTTPGCTHLDEWLARCRDSYFTTQDSQNRHLCPGGIRNPSPSKRVPADPRLRPRGHWNRRLDIITLKIKWLLISCMSSMSLVRVESFINYSCIVAVTSRLKCSDSVFNISFQTDPQISGFRKKVPLFISPICATSHDCIFVLVLIAVIIFGKKQKLCSVLSWDISRRNKNI